MADRPYPKAFETAPERIYLQLDDMIPEGVDFFELDEVTWCSEQIHEHDVEYVRADRRAAPAPGGEVIKYLDRILGITSATPGLTEAQLGEALALIQRAAERARATIADAERAKP